jgi:hypothetical protein
VLFLFLTCVCSFAQKKSKDSSDATDESIVDNIAKVIEIRKAFDVKSETTKPALFSFKKSENEDAIYTVDAAVMYMLFDYKSFGIYPALQFQYVSHGKKKTETLKGMLIGEWILYNTPSSEGKLEPSVSFSKDFFSKERIFTGQLVFQPSFPKFPIPIRNVSNIKFKYNGKDNRWIFGFNPLIGAAYEYDFEEKVKDDQNSLYTITMASMSLKRYYVTFTVFGDYQAQFEEDKISYYKYGAILSLFLDAKERSSINAKIETESKKSNKDTELSFGFGVKL